MHRYIKIRIQDFATGEETSGEIRIEKNGKTNAEHLTDVVEQLNNELNSRLRDNTQIIDRNV